MTALRRARRLSVGVEAALAFLAGAATFALVAVTVVAAGSDVAIALLAGAYVVAIAAVFRFAGVVYGLPSAVALLIALDWYWVPPTHPHSFPDAGNLADVLAYLVGGVAIGEIAAHGSRRAELSEGERSVLSEEQGALRRVATLVARGEAPDTVFAAVAEEAGALLDVDGARVVRFIGDDEILQLEGWTAPGHDRLPVGPLKLENTSLATEVMRTGGAVRIEDYARVNRVVPWFIKDLGIRSGVAAPIFVGGRLWGAMLAWSLHPRPLPDDAERRLVAFTELVGTAISNTASREELALLAREQQALRDVATLAVRGVSPSELFEAVSREIGLLLGVTRAHMARFEPDGAAMLVSSWRADGTRAPARTHPIIDYTGLVTRVFESGRPARVDRYEDVTGAAAASAQGVDVRSAVGAPIVVDGHLWGVMMASSEDPDQLGPGAESKIAAFTELVATAISNAEARAELGQLAGEQAALRRVATLVARGVSPPELFQAVSKEVGLLLGVKATFVARFNSGGSATYVGSWHVDGTPPPTEIRFARDDSSILARVFGTGRPARIENYDDASGEVAAAVRRLGIRSGVGAPIIVDGNLWGAMMAASADPEPLGPATESKIAAFTELVATAISNADARAELGQLAGEQAALRRVATLVARVAPAPELFQAVSREVGLLLDVDGTAIVRYDSDDTATSVASWSRAGPSFPIGGRVALHGSSVTARVFSTGRPARMDDYGEASGEIADLLRPQGLRSAVGAPIVVDGRQWGVMIAASIQAEPLPTHTEPRIAAFTELVATAISNAEAHVVATLVARGSSPAEVFAQVAEEVGLLLGVESAWMQCYEADGNSTIVAIWGELADTFPVGTHLNLEGESVSAIVRDTRRPARMDDYSGVATPMADL
ncbi:MAG TPA: GAF domain-containing protein, partial [Solirubrobacteraceae bacterium]|nr:GAF domain-containing protein [Solirubrobacteraceae bacterium]